MLHLSLAPVAILLSLAGAGAPGAAPTRVAQRPRPASEVRPPPPVADPSGDAGRSARSAKRERLRQKIRAMRAWYLTQELDLDEVTAGRLFALLDRYDDSLEALQKKGSRLRRLLRQEMAAARPDPAAVERHVNHLVAHYDAMYQVQRDRFSAVREVVTAEQGAKLLLLLPKIDSAIRRQIARVMRKAKRSGEGRAPGRRGPDRRRDSDDDSRPLDPY